MDNIWNTTIDTHIIYEIEAKLQRISFFFCQRGTFLCIQRNVWGRKTNATKSLYIGIFFVVMMVVTFRFLAFTMEGQSLQVISQFSSSSLCMVFQLTERDVTLWLHPFFFLFFVLLFRGLFSRRQLFPIVWRRFIPFARWCRRSFAARLCSLVYAELFHIHT